MNKESLPLWIAFATITGFISLLWIMCFRDVPTTSHDILMASTGTLGTAFVAIVSYYFGSSAGSAKKTEIMAQQVKDVTPDVRNPE